MDVFSGAGGLSAGFGLAAPWWSGARSHGYKLVFAADHDKQAMETFRRNHFPDIALSADDPRACCDDIGKVDAKRVLDAIRPYKQVDVLVGGPSCQGVSPAGLRNPDDKRNQMLLAFVHMVRELRPKWFVMENVPGLTHANNHELLIGILRLLNGVRGYQVAGDVLLAADYGVPQFRYRLFLVGTRTGAPIRFPAPSHVSPLTQRQEPKIGQPTYRTVADAIADMTRVDPLEIDSVEEPRTPAGAVENHWCRRVTEVNRKRISTIRQGGDWRDIPIMLLPERYFVTRACDQKGSYGRLAWQWPAYTMTNASLNITAGAFTHPDHDRCLSVREVARIQTFDNQYVFLGSLEAQYRQVGNAVPPLLAKAIAEAILYCHSRPRDATTWGREGRITLEFLETAAKDGKPLPPMTPRQVHPLQARATSRKTQEPAAEDPGEQRNRSVWRVSPRPKDPWPAATRRLRKMAEGPKNLRAARRSRAIVQFIDGVSRKDIVKAANASEASVCRWVDGYFAHGLDGWRAFHTPVESLTTNPPLQRAIKKRVARVRRVLIAPSRAGNTSARLHMNAYLRQLVRRFGKNSVNEVMRKVEERIKGRVGTVYVGDLLAIASAVLPRGVTRKRQGSTLRKPAVR